MGLFDARLSEFIGFILGILLFANILFGSMSRGTRRSVFVRTTKIILSYRRPPNVGYTSYSTAYFKILPVIDDNSEYWQCHYNHLLN